MQTQIQALAILPKLSEQQLINALQAGDGALPAYAVMAELQARKKRAAGFAGNGGPPRTSVKDDMVAQAQPMGLQSLAPQAQMGMADGGKIGDAFGRKIEEPAYGYSPGSVFGGDQGPNPFAPIGLQLREEMLRMPWNAEKRRALDKSAKDHVKNLKESAAEDAQRRGMAGGGMPDDESEAERRRLESRPWGFMDNLKYRLGQAADYLPDFSSPLTRAISNRAGQAGEYVKDRFSAPPPLPPLPTAPTTPTAATPPVPPKEDASSGIRTLSKTSVSTRGAPPPADGGYVPNEIKFGSFEDAMKQLPKDNSIAEYIASVKASDTSAEDKKYAINEALIRMGVGMATRPGTLIQSAMGGAGEGLSSLALSRRQQKLEENERRKELGVASIAQGRQDLERYGIGRQSLKDQADLARANETGRYNAAHLASAERMNAATNAANLQAANARAAAGGNETKLVIAAANLRHNAEVEAKALIANDISLKYKPELHQAFINAHVAKALRSQPHLLPYVNLDVYQQQGGGAGGFVAPPANAAMRAPIG